MRRIGTLSLHQSQLILCLCLALLLVQFGSASAHAQTQQIAVNGTVVLEGGGLRPNFSISFSNSYAGNNKIQAGGTFRVSLLQGAYDVVVSGLPAGYTVRSIQSGSLDLQKTQLLVIRDEAPPQISVILQASSPPPWVILNGRVTNGRNIIPPGLRLTLSSPVSDPLETGVNADGSFGIPMILPGKYSISFRPAPAWMKPLTVSVPDSNLTGIELPLPATVQLRGRMIVEDGGPLPVATLTATDVPDAAQPAQLNAAVQVGSRNPLSTSLFPQADGSFRVSLPEGQYRIAVSNQYRKPDGTNQYSVKAFNYGDVDLLVDSATVSAADTELHLTLSPVDPNTWAKVSGKVVGLSNLLAIAPAGGVQVVLSGTGIAVPFSAVLAQDGSFEFPRVYGGNYTARLTNAPLPPNVTAPFVSVTVASNDVTNVTLTVPSVKEISGQVIVEGNGPMPRFSFSLAAQPPTGGTQFININPRTDGVFSITLMEGERRVGGLGGMPPGYVLKSMMYGSTDLLREPLKVATSDTAELRVTIATANAALVEVRGRVSGLDGVPSTGAPANVILSSSTFALPITLNAPIKSDGSFVFPEVYPGTYSARVGGVAVANLPSMTIVVPSAGVANLEIALPGQRDIPGRVIVEGGGAFPAFNLPLVPVTNAQGSLASSFTLPVIRPSADGSFRVTMPEGDRFLNPIVNLPPGYSLKSVAYGSVDVMSSPFRISRTDTAELRITLVSSVAPVKVSGRVAGLADSDPLRTALRVTLTSPQYPGPLMESLRTDGSFEFTNVSPGSYTLRVTGPRLPPIMPVKPIDVGNTNIADVLYTIPGQKDVIGKASIEGGGPLPRLLLRLSTGDITTGPNASTIVPINLQADGSFRITLPEGPRRADVQLPAGYLLQTFTYGDTDLRTNPVTIAASDSAELHIAIRSTTPLAWAKVSGRVTGLNSSSTSVRVDLSGPQNAQLLSATVRSDGTFEFPQVLLGSYTARLIGVIGAPAPTPVNLTVASRDVTDLTIAVSRQFLLRGRVVVSGAKGAEGTDARAPIAIDVRRPGGPIVSSTLAKDDFFLTVESGDHTIAVGNVPAGYQIQSLVFDSTDLLKAPLRVSGPSDGEIILTLKKLSSSASSPQWNISGRVTGELSRIPNPRRLLINGPGPSDLHEVEIKSNGKFELKNISPGTYTIRVSGVAASSALPETVVVLKNVSGVKITVH